LDVDRSARYANCRGASSPCQWSAVIELSIADIAADFPDYRVVAVVAEDLTIAVERPAGLDELLARREAEARERWRDAELSRIPGIAAWRAAYRRFGIKQTRYRSSVERLLKNVLADRPLARINAFVDAYNGVSLAHVLPLGADDLDRIVPPLAFRYARESDTFLDMAEGGAADSREPTLRAVTAADEAEGAGGLETPKAGEVVYTDAEKVLCRRWNWRQDARSLITPDTRRAIVTVQAQDWGDVERAAEDLVHLITRFCGGRCSMVALNADRRTALF